MTTFEKETKAEETKTEVVKVIAPKEPLPPSPVRTDPKLWEEACKLAEMLSYCRPDKSRAEAKFIARYLVPLGVTFDKAGNVYKTIGENPTVLWSSHTDTVHRKQGIQKVEYFLDDKTGECWFQVGAKCKSSCLGADDTIGVWLMVEMIKAKIPGLYIFHRGEEVGRKGSLWIAEKNKEVLQGIKYAIAFDRRNEKSIITYQCGKKCCSNEFVKSLADQLGMKHDADSSGAYTDTASYVDLIPECTNISAGYINAHCWDERTNVDYAFRLRDAVLKLDLTKLVEARKAGDNEALYKSYTYYGGEWGADQYDWEANGWKKEGAVWTKSNTDKKKTDKLGREGFQWHELNKKYGNMEWKNLYEWSSEIYCWVRKPEKPKSNWEKPASKATFREAVRMVRLNPEIVADLLDQCGYDPDGLREYLMTAHGWGIVNL